MIAFLAAAALATSPASALPGPAASNAPLAPAAVLVKYQAAIAALKEPRVFVVEYTLEQTGTRTLEQTHRVFRSGGDERDETLAVNGNRSVRPLVRIFRKRPYRYSVRALAPKPAAYDFAYAGPHRDGKHVDYVFRLAPTSAARAFGFTEITIDGVSFLPSAIAFATNSHGGRGTVTFKKASTWWVASGATASARIPGGVAREQLTFNRWRFPPSLPPSTFAAARPLPSAAPGLP